MWGLLLVYVTPGRAWRTKPLQHSVFKWQLGTSSTFKFLQTPLNFFIKIYKQMMAVSCSFVTKNEMKLYYGILSLEVIKCDWQLDSVITMCSNLVKGLLVDLTDENVWHLYKGIEGAAANAQVKQLEQQNSRLKEAIMRWEMSWKQLKCHIFNILCFNFYLSYCYDIILYCQA